MNSHLPLRSDSRVVRVETVMSAHVGREVVMLNMATNAYYDADDIGAVIWQQLEQPTTVQALVDELVSRYEVEATDCQRDVLTFLNDARLEGLIRIIDDPEPPSAV
jgi:hypothetical protein